MAEPRIETARLNLVPLNAHWNDDIFRLLNEPEVADWLFLTGPPTREQVEARMKAYEQFWAERGYGLFAVLEKPADRFVARVGAIMTPETGRIEIAWTTAREAWGKGYASEAARAVQAMLPAHLPQMQPISLIHAENERSIALALALGATLEKRLEFRDAPFHQYRHRRHRD